MDFFDGDWVPGGVVSKKKECKGEKSIRMDLKSEYVDSVGKILGEIGFLAKRGKHKHISVEEGMDGASILKDFQQEKAKWNIVLVTVFDDYIEKMATIKAEYTPR